MIRPETFPAPFSISLEQAKQWQASPDWIYEEKLDGYRAIFCNGKLFGRSRTFDNPGPGLITSTLDGELVGGVYFVFDILEHNGQDLRGLPLWQRRQVLNEVAPTFPAWMRLIPSTRACGGEFLEAVLANGGEGVVAKNIHARYGFDWYKAKRVETHDCVVAELLQGAARLIQYRDGRTVECGKVQAGQRWGLTVGDVVEIACHNRTAKGKFREPRIIRVRTDKPAADCVAAPV